MDRRVSAKKAPLVFGLSVLISFGLFALDRFKTVDIAVWLFYLIPLLATSYVAPRRVAYLLLVMCTALIGLGFEWGPTAERTDVAILNRLIGVTVLWLTIVILLERKRAEDALRVTKQRYEDLVELSPETIYIRQDGKLVFVNPAGVRLFGATREEDLLGKPVADFVQPASPGTPSGSDAPADETYLRLDGTAVQVETAFAPIDHEGRPAVQVFVRNVTRRAQLEEQLRQSQKIEAVGRLAGGIAHDFNNLMTVVTGYVALTKKRLTDPGLVSKGLEEIGKASHRATRLTQQLIAFSRKQILQPQILDLNHIVSNMDRMLRRLIGEDIELETVLEPRLGKVKADPGQIEQVVVNLTLNARDAMPRGGRLVVETANVDLAGAEPGGYHNLPVGPFVQIVFRDNGIGMDEETRSHIFEPYFTTKAIGKGSGLGLATVYGIIRQSGGDVRVASDPGRGSTFTILLPRSTDAEPSAEDVEPTPDIPGGGRETVLLVEDEEPVRVLLRETLEEAGYTVLEAPDGEEALAIVSRRAQKIHLLLSDVVMPKMGGRELADRVTSLRPETKVLLMSGYAESVLGRQNDEEAPQPFLFKPFTPNDLIQKVRAILDA